MATVRAEELRTVWFALPHARGRLVRTGVIIALLVLMFASSARVTLDAVAFASGLVLMSGFGMFLGRSSFVKTVLNGSEERSLEYLFDDHGCCVTSDADESRTAWAEFERQIQTNHWYVLFTSPESLTAVPKRAFSTHDQGVLARELAARIPYRTRRRDMIKFLAGAAMGMLVYIAARYVTTGLGYR
jgi:hypothetical protein